MHFVCYSSFLDPLEHYAVMYKCEDDTISSTTDSKISWQYCVIVSAVSPGGSRLCMGLAQSRNSIYGLKLEKASRFDISVASLLNTNILLPQEQQHVQLS